MKRNKLTLALAGCLLAPVVGGAYAQNAPTTAAPPDQNSAKQLQAITVTGSAIPRIDTETPSPVTTISAADIARSGYTTVSDLVRSISADNSGSIPNAFSTGFAVGASGVALRGLTVDSTLVLIDGKRNADYAAADDGERSFVDMNTIPIVAVERIEVLKDGASSLYGADAIGGVINIILKPAYRGVEMTADVGNSQRGGGFTKKATILGGTGDLDKDGYNLYAGLQFESDQAIQAGSRPFPFNTSNLSSIGGTNASVPSSNRGSIYGSVMPGTATDGNILNGVPLSGAQVQPLRACGSAATLVNNDPNNPGSYCLQNFSGQYAQDQPQTKQFGFYTRATFKLNDTTKAYVSASMNQFQTWVQDPTGPAQIQSSTPTYTNNIVLPWQLPNGQLNPNNPFAAQHEYALINYAFGGLPFETTTDNHNARLVGDLAGTVGSWNYDASLVFNHTSLSTAVQGYLSYNALYDAVVNGTYNFINPAANSAAELHTLAPGYNTLATSDLDSLDFSANRELWDLPGGASALALGVQYRYEAQDYPEMNPNGEFQNLNIVQAGGHRTVAGAYFEFDAPILSSLEADVSGRFDHYSDFGNNFSPKLGLKWKPLDWFALRGTFSKGFRAPSFAEMGNGESGGGVPIALPAAYLAAHNYDGYTQSAGIEELDISSHNLKPEKSTSATFGVLIQPTDWLNASLDYYQIKKTDVISMPNWGPALAAYFAGQPIPAGITVTPGAPDPNYPGLLPKPIALTGPYINANWLKTNGIDLDLQAHFKFANSMQWVSEISGTDIFNWQQSYGPGQVYQFVGEQAPDSLSSGAGTPRLRGSWSNTLIVGPASVTATVRYTSGMRMVAQDVGILPYPGSCLSTGPDGSPLPASCWTGAFTDVDLTGSYMINDHLTLTASIFNLFNRLPPFDPASYSGINYNPTYAQAGIVGRFFNVGVKLKL